MVFKVFDENEELSNIQIQNSTKNTLGKLTQGGLEIRLFYSLQVCLVISTTISRYNLPLDVQRKEVYCKVQANPNRLFEEADRIDYKVILNEKELREVCIQGKRTE